VIGLKFESQFEFIFTPTRILALAFCRICIFFVTLHHVPILHKALTIIFVFIYCFYASDGNRSLVLISVDNYKPFYCRLVSLSAT